MMRVPSAHALLPDLALAWPATPTGPEGMSRAG
jgi:hypothetical protein